MLISNICEWRLIRFPNNHSLILQERMSTFHHHMFSVLQKFNYGYVSGRKKLRNTAIELGYQQIKTIQFDPNKSFSTKAMGKMFFPPLLNNLSLL